MSHPPPATGSGAKGTTINCASFFCPASPRTDGYELEFVDTIGVGTMVDDDDGGGNLLTDLEEMRDSGEKFNMILFCVRSFRAWLTALPV